MVCEDLEEKTYSEWCEDKVWRGGVCTGYASNNKQHHGLFTAPKASWHFLATALLLNTLCLQMRIEVSRILIGKVSGHG